MIGVQLDRAKSGFADRLLISQWIEPAERRVLSKFGAFVRRRSRSSIRFSKSSAPPGSPPKAHSKDKFASLRNILFSLDPTRASVVIGPVLLNQKNYLGGNIVSGTVPNVLESGGTEGIREKLVGTRWRSIGRRKPRAGQAVRIRLAQYEARPFMKPAFEKEHQETLPKLWRNAI